jgi:hypothetical protein
MENYIKEAKRGFSIDRISTGKFKANELDLQIKTALLQFVLTIQTRLLRTGACRLHHRSVSFGVFPLRGEDHSSRSVT